MTPRLLVLLCLLGAAARAGTPPVSYSVTLDPSARTYAVTLTIREPVDHSVDLFLTNNDALYSVDSQFFVNTPVAKDATGTPRRVTVTGPSRWRVADVGRPPLTVSYSVAADHRARFKDKTSPPPYELPCADATHALFASGSFLIMPALPGGRFESDVRFVLPAGWNVVAPWESDGAGLYRIPDTRDLRANFAALGRWKTREGKVGSFRFAVAFAGDHPLADTIVESIERIVREALKLFGCAPRGSYLFIVPEAAGHGGWLAGAAKSGSIVLDVPDDYPRTQIGRLHFLVAHEFFHTWPSSVFDLPQSMVWFSEGLAEYYSRVLTRRAGLLPTSDLFVDLGRELRTARKNRYFGEKSLAALSHDFVTDNDAYELTYGGGLIATIILDGTLRQKSGGKQNLDTFLHWFTTDGKPASADRGVTLDDLLHALRKYSGNSVADVVEALAREPIDEATIDSARALLTKESFRPDQDPPAVAIDASAEDARPASAPAPAPVTAPR